MEEIIVDMLVVRKGQSLQVTLGIVKAIKDFSVVLSVGNEDVEVDVSRYTMERIKEIEEVTPFALLPIHMETKSILLDVELPESGLEELQEDQFLE